MSFRHFDTRRKGRKTNQKTQFLISFTVPKEWLRMEQTQTTFNAILINKGLNVLETGNNSDGTEVLVIDSENILKTLELLKDSTETRFNMLVSISGVDTGEGFEVVYHLFSTINNKKLVVRCRLNKNNPEIQSIAALYTAADWHEREVYDLFGIKFLNHPDLRRILLPNDWIGHPLRKDYVLNDERLSWNER